MLNKNILEVGSGTGLTGLAAACLGSSLTVLTDLGYTLDNLKANVEFNFPINEADYSCETNVMKYPTVRVHELDWSKASTYIKPADLELNLVEASHSNDAGALNSKNEWDVILGADVVWLEELVEPLVTALRELSSSATVIYLAHQVRKHY